MTDLKQAAQQALEALKGLFGSPEKWESGGVAVWRLGGSDAPRQAITALHTALEQQAEPVAWAVQACSKMWRGEFAEIDSKAEAKRIGGTCVAYPLYTTPPQQQAGPSQWRDMVVVSLVREGINKHRARELADHFAAQQQAKLRLPKVGDKVICLEDESLGEVVSLTAGGSPDITFNDGSRGTYMLREFVELFGYVAAHGDKTSFNDWWNGDYDDSENPYEPGSAGYWAWAGWQAAKRQWVGLTDEEWQQIQRDNFQADQHKAIEAKLKEKNSDQRY